jgi:hypothetical protein
MRDSTCQHTMDSDISDLSRLWAQVTTGSSPSTSNIQRVPGRQLPEVSLVTGRQASRDLRTASGLRDSAPGRVVKDDGEPVLPPEEGPLTRGMQLCLKNTPLFSEVGRKLDSARGKTKDRSHVPICYKVDPILAQGVYFIGRGRLHAYGNAREREITLFQKEEAVQGKPFQQWMKEAIKKQPAIMSAATSRRSARVNLAKGGPIARARQPARESEGEGERDREGPALERHSPLMKDLTREDNEQEAEEEEEEEQHGPAVVEDEAERRARILAEAARVAARKQEAEERAAQEDRERERQKERRAAAAAAAAAAAERAAAAESARAILVSKALSEAKDLNERRRRQGPGQDSTGRPHTARGAGAVGVEAEESRRPLSARTGGKAPWRESPRRFPMRPETPRDYVASNCQLLRVSALRCAVIHTG